MLLAETFCDPEAFAGTMYRAAGWEGLGGTKGFACANGRCTAPHGRPKEVFVTALRPDARALSREALEDVVSRWSRPRIPVADGKRIRDADRNGDGHERGAPFARLNFDDDGGALAATQDVPGRSDIGGKVITLDTLHTTRRTARLVTERADYVFVVKGNASKTFDILDTIARETVSSARTPA